MEPSEFASGAVVEVGDCWGRLIGEDANEGACDLCVDVCPEVFEKPRADRCARARAGVDPIPYGEKVRRAMALCPMGAILLSTPPA